MKGLVRSSLVLSAVGIALSSASLFINILTLKKANKIKKIAN